jgi:hypothetical protein
VSGRVVLLAALVIGGFVVRPLGQQPDDKPFAFEVAAVKANASGGRGVGITRTLTEFTTRNAPLSNPPEGSESREDRENAACGQTSS